MKKIIFVAGAMLMVSVAAIVGYKAYDRTRMTDFMKANIEALTKNESIGNIKGRCDNSLHANCIYTCRECGSHWIGEGQSGVVISISGYCDCGTAASI